MEERSQGYPAAHSMDTEWFGVDDDGHVALFASHDNGAVPHEVTRHGSQAVERLLGMLPVDEDGLAVLDVDPSDWRGELTDQRAWELARSANVQEVWGQGEGVEDLAAWLACEEAWPLLMNAHATGAYLRTEDAGGFALAPVVRLGHQAPIFYYRAAHPGRLIRLLLDGQVLGAEQLRLSWWSGGWDVSRLGIFFYDHDHRLAESAPYTQVAAPARGLRLEALGPQALSRLGPIRFDGVRFAQTLQLQPAELTACASWERAWVDTSGRRHNF